MYRRTAIAAAIAAALAGPAGATDVRVPLQENGAGDILPASVQVRLVDSATCVSDACRVRGFVGGNGMVTEYTAVPLKVADAVLELVPTADIATPSGDATWYWVRVQDARGATDYHIQVPDSDTEQQLEDLVGAAAIAPGSVLATRLPPDPSDAGDGQFLTTSDGLYILADVAPGSGIGDAPTDGAQYCRQSGAWEVCEGGSGGAVASVTDTTTIDLTLSAEGALSASAIEAGLEAVLDLADLQGAVTDAQVPNSITVSLADTATALATNPTDCAAGQYATAIDASGNLTCGTPAGGGATNLSTSATTTTVTIASDTGEDAVLSAAVGGSTAGILSAAQAALIASALQSETDAAALAAIAALDAGDVGADPAGTAASAVSAHAGAADPHAGYALESALGTAAYTASTAYATAAQGSTADAALQPADLAAGTITASAGALDLTGTAGQVLTIEADGDVAPAGLPAITETYVIALAASGENIATGTVSAPAPWTATLASAAIQCKSAPVSAATVVDVRYSATAGGSGSTVLSAAISVGTGTYTASGTITSSSVAAGGRLDFVITQADACADAAAIITATR